MAGMGASSVATALGCTPTPPHDQVNGVQYFRCEPGHGIITSVENVTMLEDPSGAKSLRKTGKGGSGTPSRQTSGTPSRQTSGTPGGVSLRKSVRRPPTPTASEGAGRK